MIKLKPKDLELKIPDLSFKTTEELQIKDIDDLLVQEKAIDIINVSLKIHSKGSNIFVVGPVGTGRRTLIKNIINKLALKEKTPPDLIYVNDFDNISTPKLIKLGAGDSKKLKKDIEIVIDSSVQALKNGIQSEEYGMKISNLEKEYIDERKKLWEKLKKQAIELNFTLEFTSGGIISVPMVDGKPVADDAYESLSEEQKQLFEDNSPKLRYLIESTMNKIANLDKKYREQLKNLQKYWAQFSINKIFEPLEITYKKHSDVMDFIHALKNDISSHSLELTSDNEETIKYFKEKRYALNIIVDNSALKGAPVIEDISPTYSSLIGRVEYYSQMGALQTDFTMIKAGNFHKANGGFLILDAEKVLKKYYVWDALKRTLLMGEIKIENLETAEGLSSIQTLEPETLPLSLKVIMIGEEWIYDMLVEYDNDFQKLFAVKAPFDHEMEVNNISMFKFANFISSVVNQYKIRHLTKEAVMQLIKYACRKNETQKKISLVYSEIKNLILEANYFADKNKSKGYITEENIKQALTHRESMFSMHKDKYYEYIKDNIISIETKGKKVGQINGLTVISMIDYTFGHPAKITAKAFKGNGEGIIDIHRSVDMSGRIHKKSIMIIETFFDWMFSKWIAEGFSASMNFEQVYSMIDGDSATLAEMIALLSAISEVPIKQNISITGSMNQHGEVQPIGGAIYKIEGFFDVCKMQGLTGDQGVIIPHQNANDLVLKDEVLEAVKANKFHIWTVKTLNEAIEILTDMKAGEKDKTHKEFEENTFFHNVVLGLKKFNEEDKKKKKKSKKGKDKDKKTTKEEETDNE